MKFSATLLALASCAAVIAAPVEHPTVLKARSLYDRHFPGQKLAKRNNGGITDADILNFALNLEYLEAQFYHIAAFGTQLSQDLLSGTGKRGYVQGNAGNQVPFSTDLYRQYAEEIAINEMDHVKFLRTALGDQAVAMPELNLNSSFTNAAIAAGIIEKGQSFDPFSSDAFFLLGAFLFEDVGVTAYNGAAPLIQNKEYLAAAASILAVEAYHAAAIRVNLVAAGQTTPAYIAAANKAAAAEASLGNGKMEGVTVNGQANVVNADDNSLAFARTPGEVLNIVYLTTEQGATMGGFFPNGLNGNIKMAAGAGK